MIACGSHLVNCMIMKGTIEAMSTSIPNRRAVSLNAIVMIVVLLAVIGAIVLLFANEKEPGIQPKRGVVGSGMTSEVAPKPPIAPLLPKTSVESAIQIPDEEKPKADAHFEPASLQLGFVRPEAVVTREFKVVNDSSKPLVLRSINQGCSCTKVAMKLGEIPPGGSKIGTATFTAGMTPTTRNNKIKLLFQNHSPMTLDMNAVVSRAVRVLPPDFRMHSKGYWDGAPDRPRSQFRISSVDGTPFRILSSGGKLPKGIAGKGDPSIPSTEHILMIDIGEHDIQTLLDPQGVKLDPFWLVETDHPETPVVEVRVLHKEYRPHQREKDREWFFVENRVVVDPINAGQAGQFQLPVLWSKPVGQRKQQITSVESRSPDFQATLLEMKADGKKSQAVVGIRPRDGFVGPFQGVVELVSHEHRVPLVVIGYVWDVKSEK